MSRNLASTNCDRCGATRIILDESPRLITRRDAGRYAEEYSGMKVANATCPRCQAQYLAWVSDCPHGGWIDPDDAYFDLSYRSTFNDEPGMRDLPKPIILDELDERLEYAVSLGALTTGTLVRARDVIAECLGWEKA